MVLSRVQTCDNLTIRIRLYSQSTVFWACGLKQNPNQAQKLTNLSTSYRLSTTKISVIHSSSVITGINPTNKTENKTKVSNHITFSLFGGNKEVPPWIQRNGWSTTIKSKESSLFEVFAPPIYAVPDGFVN